MMKKNYNALFYTILSLLFFFSCQEAKKSKVELKPLKEKKEKKDVNSKHKKGIEHIADYQREIRKSIEAENSTYKNGYLMTEFNKAKQFSLAKRSTSAISPVFKERGPVNVPGRTRGIAIDPTDSNRWYLGTVGGGVWLTEDAGVTWATLTDFKIPNLATSTIVISPSAPGTLYVGTGEPYGNLGAIGGSGLFKTTDSGATWMHLSATTGFGDVGKIIINPTDENNVLVGSREGVFRTTDGGTTWTKTYASTGTIQDLDADPSNFNIQYGSEEDLGIVKSTDGGVTWTTSTLNNTTITGANYSRFETAVSEVNPSVVIVCAYSNDAVVSANTDLYISKDSGVTFTNLTAPTGATADRLDLVGGQGWYDNVVLTHPFDENIFYVGGVELFKVTVNNDDTFTALEIAATNQNSNLTQINTKVHVDQHGLAAIKGTGTKFKLILANDGGVFVSNMADDSGVNQGDWSTKVLGKNSTQFYGATKQNGVDNYLAGAQDNGTWISQGGDSDKDKKYLFARGGDGFKAVWHYNNPQDFLGTSQNNGLSRYINFTSTAINGNIRNGAPFYSKLDNANNNPDVVFTVTRHGVWRSTDFGGNWNLIPIATKFSPGTRASSALNVRVSPADPNVVWAGSAMTQSGSWTFHVSEDNGQTFTAANTFSPATGTHNLYSSGFATSYIERDRAYLLFSNQGKAKIIKTEDLGQTWTDISGFTTGGGTGFPDVAVHSLLEMPFNKDILWAGTDIGVFETEDGGATWNILTDIPSVAVYDMKVVNNQVVIASYGRGIWSATIPELNTYVPVSYLALSDFNTTQSSIVSKKGTIKYDVSSDDVSRVKIFVDGVEVDEIINDFSTGVIYETETLLELTEGKHVIGVQLFDDTNNLQTVIGNKDVEIVYYNAPGSSIEITEFTSSDMYAFNGSFDISDLSGSLTGNVVSNLDHPYKDATTYAMVLKQPLIISQSNKDFTYEDVAITEPFETAPPHNLTAFYDFVIIEASTDLSNWTIIDKYDARRYPEWLAAYNGGTGATDALFKEQTVDLTTKGFVDGDTVVFRFSLVADANTNSFGWAIKSINDTSVASVNDVLSDKKAFTIYPTVSNGNFTVFAKNTLGNSTMNVFDIRGKQVYKRDINFTKNNKQEVSVNLTAGVYIVNLIDENNKKSSGKIVIE